jgi:hypothetical protein
MKTDLQENQDNDNCPLCGNDTLDMGYGLAGGGGIGVYYFCKTDKCSYFHKTPEGAEK